MQKIANTTHDDLGKLVLRIVLAGLILFHGIGKLGNAGSLGFIGGALGSHGLPEWIAYGVYFGEVVGPIMILLGLYARAGAIMVAINMLFAIGLAHAQQVFALTDSGTVALELQYFYLFGAVSIALLGAGRYALVRPQHKATEARSVEGDWVAVSEPAEQ